MHITAAAFKAYIEEFHRALEATAKEFLPTDAQKKLPHLALLPARIVGYVSTQAGVGFEYFPSSETTVEVELSSSRVEDIFLKVPSRYRNTRPMVQIATRGTGVSSLTLSGGFPFRLITPDASVSFEDVGFQLSEWNRIVRHAEIFADRSIENWSLRRAEARAKDEVLAAMVRIQRAQSKKISIDEYIATFKDRTILLLGDYEPDGAIRLQSISREFEALGYEVILVKDIPDHPHQDISQKVIAIGSVSRFIVADDSSKSGHLLEIQLCKQSSWITILLRANGQGGSWMTAGASFASNVILEQAYDPTEPRQAVIDSARWAENKINELQNNLKKTYPWRSGSS